MKTVPDKRQIEAGRLLFAQACDFIAGAANLTAMPAPRTTEIAPLPAAPMSANPA